MQLKLPKDDALKADLQAIGRQAPFAASIGLNRLGDRVQEEIRQHVRGRDFMLRRPTFVLRTIKRERGADGDFASRNRLQASVRLDPDPKRDVLAKHVDGGRKTPMSGRSLMVPVGIKGRGAGGIITAAQRAQLRVDPKVVRIKATNGKELLVRFSGRGRRARADVLFRLVPSVPLRPRLPIYDIARRVCDANWLDAMRDGIMEAMIRNVRGSGGVR